MVVDILKSYFNNEKKEFNGDSKEIIKEMNKQSLASYLYFVYPNNQAFKRIYFGATLIQEKFFYIQNELTRIFNENNIDHYFLKGSVISSLYPDVALRSRGDIDIVVRKDDYKRAKQILSSNDFIYQEEAFHHSEYLKNNMLVELHRELFDPSFTFYNYFNDTFKDTAKIVDNLYKLNENRHFLFALCHLDKHLVNQGEGIRYLLDFYYMLKKWPLDLVYITTELKNLGLYDLFVNICDAIRIITNEDFLNIKANGELLINYMLNDGIHGKQSDDVKSFTISKESKFKYFLNLLFLPKKEERQKLYPRLSKSILLYPILLIHRFFRLLITGPKKFIKVLKTKNVERKKMRNNFEKIGIKK